MHAVKLYIIIPIRNGRARAEKKFPRACIIISPPAPSPTPVVQANHRCLRASVRYDDPRRRTLKSRHGVPRFDIRSPWRSTTGPFSYQGRPALNSPNIRGDFAAKLGRIRRESRRDNEGEKKSPRGRGDWKTGKIRNGGLEDETGNLTGTKWTDFYETIVDRRSTDK